MGTNYYFRYNICSHCGRYDSLHIGKNSYGWQFTFQALDEFFDAPFLDGKVTLQVNSFLEWKEIIERYVVKEKTAKIYNEYGDVISVQDFYDIIEKSKGEKNHRDYMLQERKYDETSFKDSDGNAFINVDFS